MSRIYVKCKSSLYGFCLGTIKVPETIRFWDEHSCSCKKSVLLILRTCEPFPVESLEWVELGDWKWHGSSQSGRTYRSRNAKPEINSWNKNTEYLFKVEHTVFSIFCLCMRSLESSGYEIVNSTLKPLLEKLVRKNYKRAQTSTSLFAKYWLFNCSLKGLLKGEHTWV